jgi:hypothetical protein
MEEGHLLRIRPLDVEPPVGARHEGGVVQRSRNAGGLAVVADQQHVPEIRERRPDSGDLPPVQGLRGDEHTSLAGRHADANRLGAERGEHRAEHAAALECAERGDVELGNAAGQGVDALARAHAERAQDIGEAARQLGEAVIGIVDGLAALAEPPQRHVPAVTVSHVTVDRLMGNVQPSPARQPVEGPARALP